MGRVIHKKDTEQQEKPGLYVISTPIGNLQDLSLRAIKILDQCELILAEDTRMTNKLFNSVNIIKKKNQLLSCYKFNEKERIHRLNFEKLSSCMVGLVSDAGTPSVSDPGSKIVEKYHQLGLPVFSVPGCCSAMAGFSISGIELKNNQTLTFGGFFPRKEKDAHKLLDKLSCGSDYVIFFETVKRLESLLDHLGKFFDEDVFVFLAKEMTKIHEATWRGYCSEILAELRGNGPKKAQFSRGELVVIVNLSKQKKISTVSKEFEFWLKTLKPHVKSSVLAKILSEKFGKNRQAVYAEYLKH
ncbi:16S rRNA (cytidine(1402)-2'-O)-methyltransferase [Betaproteobacteria bacterium]|nr:16S rRNA (cytidine(1402)-2'-O)-methyltransferase [Betaproteobacteria bacterium]